MTTVKKLITSFLSLCLILLASVSAAESSIEKLQEMYASAELKMATGDYSGAAALFDSMGSYSDSSQMAMYCKAISAAEDLGMFDIAIDTFSKLGEFKDCPQMEIYYTGRASEAVVDSVIENISTVSDEDLKNAGTLLDLAKTKYAELALFKDSLTRLSSCNEKEEKLLSEIDKRKEANLLSTYNNARDLEKDEKYEEAIAVYTTIKDYKDSSERITICQSKYKEQKYVEAERLRENKKWNEAVAAFKEAGDYNDAKEQITETHYQHALYLIELKDYLEAYNILSLMLDYKDVERIISDNPHLDEIRNSVIRFDGVYICHVEKKGNIDEYNACLRFYEDGTVISTSVSGFPKAKWFNRDNKSLAQGSFTVENFSVKINVETLQGYVEYSGTIVGKKLMLTVYSGNKGVTSEKEYDLYSYDDIPNWYE